MTKNNDFLIENCWIWVSTLVNTGERCYFCGGPPGTRLGGNAFNMGIWADKWIYSSFFTNIDDAIKVYKKLIRFTDYFPKSSEYGPHDQARFLDLGLTQLNVNYSWVDTSQYEDQLRDIRQNSLFKNYLTGPAAVDLGLDDSAVLYKLAQSEDDDDDDEKLDLFF